jgi:2-C-methyl-D-erythritol 2,4-cyclodiphosphate synthase
MRVGFGFDVHSLVPNRPLILGGVAVSSPLGLLGHSDADVLLHAICDAMLGAIAERDIGVHFPDTDPQYKGIQSTILLKNVSEKMKARGFHLVNIDATLVAQRPKLSGYIPAMITTIAATLEVEPGRVNVKATTSEGLGFAGRGEGMSAYAVALLEED